MTNDAQPRPYRTTPVFNQDSLPRALRQAHSTREGVWGIIRVLEGEVRYVIAEPACEEILASGRPGLIEPGQRHYVEPLGMMRMQVEFYDCPPTK